MLRPYQVKVYHQLRVELSTHRAVLLVMPCGSGKGKVITKMIEGGLSKGKRITFGVRGKNLVEDMSQRVKKLGIPHGVLMGTRKREHWHPVQVASIDTLHRMEYPPHADLLIGDEADTCMSPTWRMVIDGPYGMAKFVGMTATPIRLDGLPLGRQSGGLFDSMVLGPSEQQLIDEGYLVPSLVFKPLPADGLSSVSLGKNDNLGKQAAVCDKPKVIGGIVAHWQRHALWRKTSAYGVDTHHANAIADEFKANGIQWAYVDAETPMGDPDNPQPGTRAQIFRDLDEPNSGLMGISSVGCTSVGWDHPIVSCLILARKTSSLRLHRQLLGRASRPYPGKSFFVVNDHVGNTDLHQPYGYFEDEVPWQLEGEPIRQGEPGEVAQSVTTCRTAVIIDGVKKLPCYGTFKSGPTKCPYCGLPILAQPKKILQIDEDLQAAERPGVAENNERIMRALWDSLHGSMLKKQIENDYKPNFAVTAATAMFTKRYGFKPNPEWRRQDG